ncbi:MAG TPA: MATE family efflux transporter [Mucilaginibacter sp.]|jgi:O-antigen/teichoic acid export membrane protein|nr:MATE family efflux transporter [Mucilaginibacter sp.]
MANKIIQSAKKYISSLTGSTDDSLTGKVNFNIFVSFGLRAISVAAAFLTVSFSLKLLDTNKYGIWLAISSTVSWISVLDIGLANGLRNKIAEYFALKDYQSSKVDVSSTYAILLLIMVPVMLIFCAIAPFVNWNNVFRTHLDEQELLYTLIVVFVGLALQFVLKPIASILQGDQKIHKANQIALVCNVSPLIPIIIGAKYLKGSILFLALAQTMLPVVVMLIYSIVLFSRRYSNISPSLKNVDLKKSKALFGLSFAFFIVQIARVFILSTTEIIITRSFGGSYVTIYNLLFRYYGVAGMVLYIVLASYWSAFTNAFALNDLEWVRTSMRKLLRMAAMFTGIVALQFLLVKPVFHLWVGDKVPVPMSTSISMALYFIFCLFTDTLVIVINGSGRMRIQSIVTMITAILHIPVVLFLIRYYHMGLNSIVYATSLWVVIQGIMWRREIIVIMRQNELRAAAVNNPD